MADYNTITTYNGNGTTTDFAIPFNYQNEADVVVTRQNGAVTYTFLNPSMIRINAPLAVGDVLTIQRVTDLDPAAVTFNNGSVITAGQLNAGFNQTLYAAQEANDKVNKGLFADTLNRLDAQNRRIINVADPVSDQDAATKKWAETSGASFVAQAGTSATNAANSASAAASSATSAAGSASTATTKASEASSSASSASTSATNAASSASSASTSATNAAASASTATTKAGEAATSATNAANSASSASTSATSAANSASSAAASAAAAATALDNFDDRYLGQKTSDPTLDNDGNALLTGALYFNTTNRVMRVYDGTSWMDASSAAPSTMKTYTFVATAGQSVFSGSDANGATLSFTAPYLIVSLNGVELRPTTDYTTTGSGTITLTSGASLNDELQVQAFKTFEVANLTSGSVGFTQSGTGAVAQSVESKLKDTISIKDFGAVGDGTTDDTAAIQAAINQAAAVGKAVRIPATTSSFICGQLSVTASLIGEDRNKSRLKRKTGTSGVWLNVAAAGVSIRQLYLDGDYIAARGIEVDGYSDVTISDNIVRKIGEYFIHFNGAQRLTISGNNYKDGSNGISNLMATNSAAAVSSYDLKITGNHIENIPGTAIHIAGKQSSTDVLFAWSNPLVNRSVIANNTIFNVSGNGIIGQGYYMTIEGNTIIDAGSSSGNQAIVPQGKYISVTGNVIKGGAGVGIDMGGCTASTVTGNVVQLRAEIGIELQSCNNVTCTGNSIIDCGYGITGEGSAGIAVLEGFWGASLQSTANVVSGNTVRSSGSSGQYGISVGSGVQQCIVSSNMLVLSGTVASIYVSGTADALIFGNMTGSGEEDYFVLRGDNPKFTAQNEAGNADFWIVPQGSGNLRLDKNFANAATPANFVAQVCIPIKDAYGSIFYIPAKYGSTW